jgi:hypothetical protein
MMKPIRGVAEPLAVGTMPITRVPKQFREIQQERENFEK